MADQLKVEIVTLVNAVFSGEATEVQLPGHRGELGILPGHLPLVTLVEPGIVRIKAVDGERNYAVSTGFAEIMNNRVTLLVRTCEGAESIDIERARAAQKAAEKSLQDVATSPELRAEEAERLVRARARLAVAERATGGR